MQHNSERGSRAEPAESKRPGAVLILISHFVCARLTPLAELSWIYPSLAFRHAVHPILISGKGAAPCASVCDSAESVRDRERACIWQILRSFPTL